jgi:hypothetical protein
MPPILTAGQASSKVDSRGSQPDTKTPQFVGNGIGGSGCLAREEARLWLPLTVASVPARRAAWQTL